MEENIVKKILFVFTLVILAGCTTSPKLGNDAIQQVRDSISKAEGSVKFTSVAIWIPNSKEFRFSAVEPSVKGVVVITEKSFLFQQWGGPAGLATAKQIPFSEIKSASMITVGRSGRLVIQTTDDKYDSFASSDGAGELSIRTPTEEMHKAISSQLEEYGLKKN